MNSKSQKLKSQKQIRCIILIGMLMLISLQQSSMGKDSATRKESSAHAGTLDAKQSGLSESIVNVVWPVLDLVKALHPIAIAALMLLSVLGVCFLMTDNSELELYFKIEFSPPKTEILQ